ncbi:MAG: tetratricopeptide repeat protein [Candidatus Eremiobacterota bacterium]
MLFNRDKHYWYNRGENLIASLNPCNMPFNEIYMEAIRCYMKAISLDPFFVNAWNARGYVLYILGMYKKAITCFNKAVETSPENLDGWSNKGLTLYKMGKYKEAIKCYDKVLTVEPDFPNARHNRETISEMLNKK